jgi:hypothetical protein
MIARYVEEMAALWKCIACREVGKGHSLSLRYLVINLHFQAATPPKDADLS